MVRPREPRYGFVLLLREMRGPQVKPDPPRDEAYWADHDLSQWWGECSRGFVSSERFSRGGTDRVIERTARTKSREFRKSAPYQSLLGEKKPGEAA